MRLLSAARVLIIAASAAGTGAACASQPTRSFLVPPVEIVAMNALVNAYGRHTSPDGAYDVSVASVRRNLAGPWVVDRDAFLVNQVLHPYQGSMYHGFARSAGLNYWQSSAYTFGGSVLWEIAGETTPPSKNDQIASGIAGSFLGEPFFRMANLLIDKANGRPGFARSILVALVSPPTAFNRGVFGNEFDQVMETRDPAYDVRFEIGANADIRSLHTSLVSFRRDETMVNVWMEYGLPGNTHYRYDRPFDYFSWRATFSSTSHVESMLSRGLLVGESFRARNGSGVWGLFGTYDFISPDVFRVSTTSLAVGTVMQVGLGPEVAVQGTAMGGVGYGAAGSLHGAAHPRYGMAPEATAGLRLTFGDRVSLDAGIREHLVSDVASFSTSGHDVIRRAEGSFGLRVFRRHGLTLRYLLSQRKASYSDVPPISERRQSVGLFYTLLGPHGFGARDWRE